MRCWVRDSQCMLCIDQLLGYIYMQFTASLCMRNIECCVSQAELLFLQRTSCDSLAAVLGWLHSLVFVVVSEVCWVWTQLDKHAEMSVSRDMSSTHHTVTALHP